MTVPLPGRTFSALDESLSSFSLLSVERFARGNSLGLALKETVFLQCYDSRILAGFVFHEDKKKCVYFTRVSSKSNRMDFGENPLDIFFLDFCWRG